MPWANLLAGLYFLAALPYTAAVGNWPLIPFLALFAGGFLWAAYPRRFAAPKQDSALTLPAQRPISRM